MAGHLAVEAERQGAGPVAVMDIDPQGSLAEWWNERAAETPAFVNTTMDRLAADVARLRDAGVRLLIVDTPPAISTAIRDVVAVSDMVLIPTRPSPHDLRSVSATVAVVEEAGRPLVFVVNGATPRARITGEALIALSQHGPLAPSIIHQRVDFAASMIDGRTVMETGMASRATEEIGRLWRYVAGRLGIAPDAVAATGGEATGRAASGLHLVSGAAS